MGVCTCEYRFLRAQRHQKLDATLGARVASHYELPIMAPRNQTQALGRSGIYSYY